MSTEQLTEIVRADKQIVTPNLYTFVTTIAELAAEGWLIDLDNSPPNSFGIVYECGMYKETEQPRKMNRVEALAVARAARTGQQKLAAAAERILDSIPNENADEQ